MSANVTSAPEIHRVEYEARVENLARILHESGREAVARDKVHIHAHLPFCEWGDLAEDAREGRRIMARYLIGVAEDVAPLLRP